jgi:hypothetical protein
VTTCVCFLVSILKILEDSSPLRQGPRISLIGVPLFIVITTNKISPDMPKYKRKVARTTAYEFAMYTMILKLGP